MKKFFFAIVLCLLSLVKSQAYVQIDGIYYNLNSQTMTAEVTYGPSHFTTLYPGDHEYVRDYYYLGDIVIPESVTYEGAKYRVTTIVGMNRYCDYECVRYPGAFENCSGLTSVTIPSSVTFIGNSAFSGCSGLQKVIVPDIAAWCGILLEDHFANPLYYAKHLYRDEETIVTDLVIPSDVTSISSYTFYNCSDLTSIRIRGRFSDPLYLRSEMR